MPEKTQSNMTINERWVNVGKVPVPHSMELGGTFPIKFPDADTYYHFECVKIEKRDNMDGTYDEIYILKFASTL